MDVHTELRKRLLKSREKNVKKKNVDVYTHIYRCYKTFSGSIFGSKLIPYK